VTTDDQSRNYGSANPTAGATTLTAGSLANADALGSASVSSTATSTTAAGQIAPLTGSSQTFSNGTAGNYLISYIDGTLSILNAPAPAPDEPLPRRQDDVVAAISLSPTVTVTHGAEVAPPAPELAGASGGVEVSDTRMISEGLDRPGPLVRIVNGGVKLPRDMLNARE
jgi:hypothetical protein